MIEIINIKPNNNIIIPGKFINDLSGYTIYNKDVDIYNGDELIARFRKNTLKNNKNIEEFSTNIRSLAVRRKENRGAAAGEIDRAKVRDSAKNLFNITGCRTNFYTLSGKKSNTTICNQAKSNVIGYIDTAIRNLSIEDKPEKTKLAQYCRDFPLKYNKCVPFILDLNNSFKNHSIDQYHYQKIRNNPKFTIENTVFSTITVNYSWQSAIHKDSNNGAETYAVISVVKDHTNLNDYEGGYLLFPEFNIGFNILEKDLFIGNTQKYYHCNSTITPVNKDIIGKWNEVDITNYWYLNRISLVAYLKKSCSVAA